jgi:diacylglycerol kinase (ATP)
LLAGRREVRLGIVPLGTGNDIARHLGLPHAGAALEALCRNRPRLIDAIEVGCAGGAWPRRFALLFAAAGFAAELIRQTTPAVKRWFRRPLSYPVGFLRALGTYQAALSTVQMDDQEYRGRFLHLCAANASHAGGGVMHLAPGARMDDGQLDLCLIPIKRRVEILWNFPRLVRGTFPRHPEVIYRAGRRLQIWSEPASAVQIDGTEVGVTPASFELRAQAISVLVP